MSVTFTDAEERKIYNLIRKLGLTYAEAEQVVLDDKAIEKGEKLFELTEEQKKVVKKMTNYDSKNLKKETKRMTNRTKNATKGAIIAEIAQFLAEKGYEMVEITNKERQIAFKNGENDYELTLVQKRKPKS
jgi:glycine cleavage system regulatory protein